MVKQAHELRNAVNQQEDMGVGASAAPRIVTANAVREQNDKATGKKLLFRN
ncbi:MAG: hypothetical protein ACP5US_10990 [Candidatus Kryptoniota bacterium]